MSRLPHHRRLAVAVSLLATLAVGACSGTPTSNPGATGAGTGEIDPNAVLRVTASSPFQNLDPAQPAPGGYPYLTLIYDRLTMVDSRDEIVPGLAVSWTYAKDGSYLELALRDDVTFHDGTPFDANAVKVNIERGQTLPTSTIKQDLADITGVTVVDARTVRLNLKPGTGAVLPSALATAAGMMVSPKAIADGVDLKRAPGKAGSGPYVATEFVPNEKYVLKRAEGTYWDPNAGRLAGMEITRVPEGATRLNGVISGQTDLSFVSSANEVVQARQFGEAGQLKVTTRPFRNVLGILLRANMGDLKDKRVREAIARSVDPAAIRALFADTCTPTRSIYPGSPWEDPAATYPYEFDLAKAKALIAEVGGAKVSISFSAGTNTEQPATAIQAAMSQVGIDAKLNPTPNSETEARFIAGDFELEVSNTLNPRLDPAGTVSNYLTGNYKLATDPEAIAPIVAKAADPRSSVEERAKQYHQLWEQLFTEAWFIPVCNLTNATVASPKVVGAEQLPWTNLGLFDLRTVAMTKG
ncbi:ABC transporter substrate-binding protein [Micromonospora peucetia]|uniref:Peptide/nickel transport system substrate-binding protein n=1 Tax=Micromonospora peucetia TaxID=47871 RepID=A0A1C6VVA2_9ACTN|nr:ABC transporter substrate-binding protein [Micromonospora peucetia]SCL69820.1 peptide/nickel transport system substrate-binding protein [Micromonospora peucetia]